MIREETVRRPFTSNVKQAEKMTERINHSEEKREQASIEKEKEDKKSIQESLRKSEEKYSLRRLKAQAGAFTSIAEAEGDTSFSFKRITISPHISNYLIRTLCQRPQDSMDFYSFSDHQLNTNSPSFFSDVLTLIPAGAMMCLLSESHNTGLEKAFDFLKNITGSDSIAKKSQKKSFLAKRFLESGLKCQSFRESILEHTKSSIVEEFQFQSSKSIMKKFNFTFESLFSSIEKQSVEELSADKLVKKSGQALLISKIVRLFFKAHSLPGLVFSLDKSVYDFQEVFNCQSEKAVLPIFTLVLCYEDNEKLSIQFGLKSIRERLKFLNNRNSEPQQQSIQCGGRFSEQIVQRNLVENSEVRQPSPGFRRSPARLLKQTQPRKCIKDLNQVPSKIQAAINDQVSVKSTIENILFSPPPRRRNSPKKRERSPMIKVATNIDPQDIKLDTAPSAQIPVPSFPIFPEFIYQFTESIKKIIEKNPSQPDDSLASSYTRDPEIESIINKYRQIKPSISEMKPLELNQTYKPKFSKINILKGIVKFTETMENNMKNIKYGMKTTGEDDRSLNASYMQPRPEPYQSFTDSQNCFKSRLRETLLGTSSYNIDKYDLYSNKAGPFSQNTSFTQLFSGDTSNLTQHYSQSRPHLISDYDHKSSFNRCSTGLEPYNYTSPVRSSFKPSAGILNAHNQDCRGSITALGQSNAFVSPRNEIPTYTKPFTSGDLFQGSSGTNIRSQFGSHTRGTLASPSSPKISFLNQPTDSEPSNLYSSAISPKHKPSISYAQKSTTFDTLWKSGEGQFKY